MSRRRSICAATSLPHATAVSMSFGWSKSLLLEGRDDLERRKPGAGERLGPGNRQQAVEHDVDEKREAARLPEHEAPRLAVLQAHVGDDEDRHRRQQADERGA